MEKKIIRCVERCEFFRVYVVNGYEITDITEENDTFQVTVRFSALAEINRDRLRLISNKIRGETIIEKILIIENTFDGLVVEDNSLTPHVSVNAATKWFRQKKRSENGIITSRDMGRYLAMAKDFSRQPGIRRR